MYEEIHYETEEAQMHAPAVASIAAGKNTGVASEADLYFIACENYNFVNSEMELDFSWTAKAIERIIEVNKSLPKDDKIRVLSISAGCKPESKGYNEFIEALACQVKPDITPEEFWKQALATGDSRQIEKGTEKYKGKILNPEKLISSFE